MTHTEAHELTQRARVASSRNEPMVLELARYFEDLIVQILCQDQVFGPDELPPKSLSEFVGHLHEVDSGRPILEIIGEELASRLPRYGANFTQKRAIMLVEPVYEAVRNEWLNRHLLA